MAKYTTDNLPEYGEFEYTRAAKQWQKDQKPTCPQESAVTNLKK
jgi:hypothetical protein